MANQSLLPCVSAVSWYCRNTVILWSGTLSKIYHAHLSVSVCLSVCADLSLTSQRRHVFHAGAMTFNDARRECVADNGDLPTIEDDRDLQHVISNITATDAANSQTNSTARSELTRCSSLIVPICLRNSGVVG